MANQSKLKLYGGIGALAVGAVVIVMELKNGGKAPVPDMPGQAYYTTDDGATFFADSAYKIPPIDHNGQRAARAYVFSCDGGKHQWVQYLEKYTDADQKILETGQGGSYPAPLVKKPGQGEWISTRDQRSMEIRSPKPPEGMGSGEPQPVVP